MLSNRSGPLVAVSVIALVVVAGLGRDAEAAQDAPANWQEALIKSWYRANHGKGTLYPSPAMTEALMINTAPDLAGNRAGNGKFPIGDQSWERVNLGNVLRGTPRDVVDQQVVLKSSGQSNSRFYSIAAATKPLRVTLVWNDAIGAAANALAHDLDLEVTAGGNVYKGNVLRRGLSATGGTSHTHDNVENVFLPPGITGPVQVRVIGKNLAGDALPGNSGLTDQDFALVVSNGVNKPSLGVPQSFRVTTGLRRNATLGPGEPFKVRWRLRNVGNQPIKTFKATLQTAARDATITQPASDYGTIAPKAIVANSMLFEGKVKPGLACGQPIRLSLAGDANGEPFVLPFEIKTGKPGDAQTFSGEYPMYIPDSQDTPTISTATVRHDGIVADMQVVISIKHWSIGDLSIDLTSPDGTTVRLFNRRGGSGDHLKSTLFSDAAVKPISAGIPPFSGLHQPEEPLSAFNGKSIKGTWKLTIGDHEGSNSGILTSWGMYASRAVCD